MSNWTVTLNTWSTTRDLEDAGRRENTDELARKAQTPRRIEKRKKMYLDMIELDIINLEEFGKYEGFAIYEKVWKYSDLSHSIDMPQYFQVGLFLEAISRR